jgi:hypothetical protein
METYQEQLARLQAENAAYWARCLPGGLLSEDECAEQEVLQTEASVDQSGVGVLDVAINIVSEARRQAGR